jgi:putative membrane protein
MGAGMWVSWLLLVLLIGLVVYLVARAGGGDSHRTQEPLQRPTGRMSAQEVLADRYARGEISTQEYEERLSHLSS